MALLWAGFSYQGLLAVSLLSLSLSTLSAIMTKDIPAVKSIPHPGTDQKTGLITHIREAFAILSADPSLRWLALADSLKNGLGMSGHQFMPGFIAAVWPLWLVPLYRTLQNALGALSFWLAGPVINRFKPSKILIAGNVADQIITLTAYILSSAVSPLLLLFSQINYALGQTAERTMQQDRFSDVHRAALGSLISFAGALTTAAGTLAAGLIADMAGPATALIVLLLAAAPVNYFYYKAARLM
jgi:hypothetical protein